MATFNVFNFSNGGISGNVNWSTTSYDSGCKLNATLSITTIYGWYFTVNNGYSLTVKDSSGKVLKTVSGNTAGVSGTGTFTLCTISNLDIPYYGDKSVTITANVNLSNIYYTTGGYYLSNYSKTQNCALPNIPGASTLTCTDAYIESSASIIVSKKVSTHTHTINYTFGSLTGNIVTKSSDTTIGFTLPTSFYAQMTDSKTKTGTLSCTTYNSSGNQVGSVQTTTFNAMANEDKCKPTVSMTAVDSNTTTKNLTGDENKFIKYFSTANVTLTSTAKNSATISSRKITCGDGKSSTSASASFTNVESASFTGSATDSRGFTSTVNLNKTLIEYIKLTCNVDIYRPAPTTGEVYLKVSGNYFNSSFGTTANTITLRYRYKESTSSTWGSWNTITATKSGNTYSYSASLGTNFTYTKSYNFQINSYDKLMNLTVDKTVAQGIPVFDWGEEDFNFNVPINANGKQVLRHNDSNALIVSSDGNIYLRANGTNDRTSEILLDANGKAFINNTQIIESGSNTNGRYIKYYDGTMIQWNYMEVTDQAINTAYGSLFQGTRNITYPVAFVGATPILTCSMFKWGSSASWGTTTESPNSLTTGTLRGIDAFSRATGTGCRISWFAIGKWK